MSLQGLKKIAATPDGAIGKCGNYLSPIRGYVNPKITTGSVTYVTMVHEEEVGIHVTSHTETMVKIYVASESGATEAEDHGDGSAENPFTCLSTAFSYLTDYNYISEKLTGCMCKDIKIQIVLTGTVDYKVPYEAKCDFLVITGDGNTTFTLHEESDYSFQLLLTKTSGKLTQEIHVQNCNIILSGNSCCHFLGTYIWSGKEHNAVIENCKITASSSVEFWDNRDPWFGNTYLMFHECDLDIEDGHLEFDYYNYSMSNYYCSTCNFRFTC